MSKTLSARNQALDALELMANLLCTSHPHALFVIDPASGKTVEGYSMGVECGNDNIIWTVKMGEDCRFRSLMRARRVAIPSYNPRIAAEAEFQIDKVWRGQVCDELLALHTLGKLKRNWWEYPLVLKTDRGSRSPTHRGSPHDNQRPEVGAVKPKQGGPRGVIYIACSPRTTAHSSDVAWEFSDATSAFAGAKSEEGDGEGEGDREIADNGIGREGAECYADDEGEDGEYDEDGDEDDDEPLIEL
ncbi:unnamed protein product [Tuber aestivum]|uniref:Uncharacterized protein n=1 Tax=Tuber aestivum TaxID=59557 RepID=A0A292QAB7_9PEZI|nr:unnamed protein product [Tuber aestivum]